MFFLNLTAGEFLAVLGALGGIVTALYLLDKSRRKKVVSTFRFWPVATAADAQTSRKRMQQPWSLVLQLISLTLLLLAIAQLQWGSRNGQSRDHVVLVDTSAWSGGKSGSRSVLDRERESVLRYLAGLPRRDRVMLVRVDALSSPATPFTSSREQVVAALRESTTSASALDLLQALSFARQAQSGSGGAAGEIVYVGPKRMASDQTIEKLPANMRVIAIPADRENAGIRNMGVKRDEEETNSWEAIITLKNYGAAARRVTLRTQFAGTRFAPRAYALTPGEELEAKYNFITNTSGRLIANIDSDDSLLSDNHAELQLPGNKNSIMAAYTKRSSLLRPLLQASRHLTVRYFDPSQYAPKPEADVILLDGFAPSQPPALPSLWIHPPPNGSPLPTRTILKNAVIKTWHSDAPVQTGLHAREDRMTEAEVFQIREGAIPVASVAEGPVIALMTGSTAHAKGAVVGFDPLAGALRFSVTTPLLFANLLHWLTPEAFRNADFAAGHVGSVVLVLNPGEAIEQLKITDGNGFALPFTVREQSLQLFVDRPTVAHVVSDQNYQRILSLTLPDVAERQWSPPAEVASGLPSAGFNPPGSVDLWKWLASLGGLGIFAEWWLFGRDRRMALRAKAAVRGSEPRPAAEREKEVLSR